MNEKDKMLSGKLYNHTDPTLTSERDRASDLMHQYNKLSEGQQKERSEMLSSLLGTVGSNVIIKPPFMVDYGYNIEIGNNVFINYGTTILDCNKITIGDNVLLGPNVQIYSATHPTDYKIRQQHLELAEQITIGNDVWIGGSAIICKGVTIGNNTTIGAGSVVTKNIPDNVIAAGNPCKVIKHLDMPQPDNPIDFEGLGHINIVVNDIDEGIAFYEKLFGACPIQMFRNFTNIGFAKAAGFLDNPENITLSIAFMTLPNVNLTLELMQYHTPETTFALQQHTAVSDIAGVRHVALKVKDVYKAYEHIIKQEGVKPINPSPAYRPNKIDNIVAEEIILFDASIDIDKAKSNIVQTISNTHYCYFIDKYGVQWEFEQGHTDIGN